MDFMIDIEPAGDGVVVVRVAGEIDTATELRLRDALLAAVGQRGATHVVVDLAEVVFIDSTGVGALMAARNAAARAGRSLSVRNANGIVGQVLATVLAHPEVLEPPWAARPPASQTAGEPDSRT